MKLIDRLIQDIKKKHSPIVVGLDPIIDRIPRVYFNVDSDRTEMEILAEGIYAFNKDVIDAICDIVPIVKPQIAYYEMYQHAGILAFEKTVAYAKSKGMLVIEDAKRNDIGDTALAYANAHLGEVRGLNGSHKGFDVDFLTVSPYLGYESLQPFVDVCTTFDKGIFILVKTSNKGNAVIQDVMTEQKLTISQTIASYVNEQSHLGDLGYSAIGAVVGATYPEEASVLRKMMPHSLFLVPGYGTQGGTADDIVACFNQDGLGALVSSSRAILYGYEKTYDVISCNRAELKEEVKALTVKMREDVYSILKVKCKDMQY